MRAKSAWAALAVASLAMISLSGCTSGDSSAACNPSGASSDSITVDGDAGTAPTSVDFPTPLVAASTQTTTLTSGTGERLSGDFGVKVGLSLYNGTDASTALGTWGYDAASPLLLQPSGWATQWPGLATGLSCAATGDRLAIAMAPADSADVAANFGGSADSSLVAVVDVLSVFPSRATGADRSVDSLFPAVTLATNGQPGIATPSGDAPTETTVGVLKEGDGAVVEADSVATVQYSGWLWADDPTQFDTSWGTGNFYTTGSSGTIPGFWKALEGQKVGSQVIVAIPPADAYGDQANGTIPANSTLLFVIDILAVQ